VGTLAEKYPEHARGMQAEHDHRRPRP
jgi:hypothetical protein